MRPRQEHQDLELRGPNAGAVQGAPRQNCSAICRCSLAFPECNRCALRISTNPHRVSTQHFNEEAQCISFHPSGLHLLVGFSDKLRMLNVLMNDIRPFKEFSIKACKEARFSNGGHLFAAVNGNTINVFSTYTCENIGNLRGHNGKVRSSAPRPPPLH